MTRAAGLANGLVIALLLNAPPTGGAATVIGLVTMEANVYF
jgi:hypothetical protein